MQISNFIDTTFDFTTDTPNYWTDFWKRNNGLGGGGNDPDTSSKTLRKYHQILWSKELPCGQYFDLSSGTGHDYLTYGNFRFGSDSLTASFRYRKYEPMITQIKLAIPDYKTFIEDFLRKSYTIGGTIIFPKRQHGSINQRRGCHPQIKDRWDLTLECIRRFYHGEKSPLYDTLEKEKDFFNLFVDFKGYVDFFFLQDCVTEDYGHVKFWLGDGTFTSNPLPKTVLEYLHWINLNLEFVEKRNSRIKDYCNNIL